MDNQPKKTEHPKDDFDPGQLVVPEDEANSKPTKPKKFKAKSDLKKIFRSTALFLLAIAAIGGLAYGGYVLFLKEDKSAQTAQTPAPSEQSEQTAVATAQALTETYTSSALRLDLMHPSDWTVNEVDRGVSILSPQFSYTDISGQEVSGNFRVYIRKGARSVDGNYLGDGYAIKNSEKISYTAPESDQRAETYLTAFGLKKPDNFAYFIVQGNFDLKRGDTLGPKFAREVDAYLIFGGYSNSSIKDDLASNSLSIDQYDKTAQYLTGVEIVKSLKLR